MWLQVVTTSSCGSIIIIETCSYVATVMGPRLLANFDTFSSPDLPCSFSILHTRQSHIILLLKNWEGPGDEAEQLYSADLYDIVQYIIESLSIISSQ